MRNRWTRLIKGLVLVAALGFLAALVRSQWSALHNYNWQLAPGWVLTALIGFELTWFFEAATWRAIIVNIGGSLTYRQVWPIWFLSNIVRYIPGNVWQFLGMAELAAEHGVPRLVTLTGIVLHQVISITVAIVLAAAYFAATGQGTWFDQVRPVLWLTPLGLLLLQPRLLERVLNWALARLGRPPIRVTLSWGQIVLLCLRYTIVWLGLGLSYAALVRALTPFPGAIIPHLAAAWTAAYVIGFLSLLTPSGLGVREGVMILLLNPILPPPLPAVVAIIARLWMVVGELAGAGLALLMRPAGRKVPARRQAMHHE